MVHKPAVVQPEERKPAVVHKPAEVQPEERILEQHSVQERQAEEYKQLQLSLRKNHLKRSFHLHRYRCGRPSINICL